MREGRAVESRPGNQTKAIYVRGCEHYSVTCSLMAQLLAGEMLLENSVATTKAPESRNWEASACVNSQAFHCAEPLINAKGRTLMSHSKLLTHDLRPQAS